MKRSEAVKHITKEIQNWMSKEPCEMDANLILVMVEQMGMLPPYSEIALNHNFKKWIAGLPGGHAQNGNDWDPEEESQ